MSFLAVYRELFEIVLFYQALWAQAGDIGGAPLLAGVGTCDRDCSRSLVGECSGTDSRLPIEQFFKATSVVLAVLAVIFVGQGVSALQEAGAVGSSSIAFVRVPALGIFPTAQTIAAQVAGVAIVAGSFVWASRHRIVSIENTDGR